MAITTQHFDRLTASSQAAVPWCYGRHVVSGNLMLRHDEESPMRSTLFIALGEGEWDAAETVWLDGVVLDPSAFHFHPGKDGEVGTGGVTGDQKIDAWFPAGIEQLAFSRTAYLVVRVNEPQFSPTGEFDVRGIYRTRKVKTFDGAGVQLGFVWSQNPVWQVLDLLLLEHPTSRIDFATFAAEAAYSDQLITIDGVQYPRFVSHVAFTQQTDLGRALETILATCRGYLIDDGGKISIRIDKARTAAHTLRMSNIQDGSFRAVTRDTRRTPNKLRVEFRDIQNDWQFGSLGDIEREWHQDLVGRTQEQTMDLGNTYQQQARRIGHYFLTRAVDDQQMISLRALADAAHLQPGDRVDVEHIDAPWPGLKAFEVIEATDEPDETRELLLQEYDINAFTDSGEPKQTIDGGVILGPRTIPAPNVLNPSASENKIVTEDGGIRSFITCTADEPNPLGTYRGCEIWARVLGSGDEYTFRAKGEDFPIYWTEDPTGETLELRFVSYNLFGRLNNVATAPTTNVTLDAEPDPPAAIADLWCLQEAYSLRLSWREGAEPNLRWYHIYDCGSVTPANDAAITEAQRIAVVPANRLSGTLARYDFFEQLYRGSSDGTVVTLSADAGAEFFPASAHVVGGVGKQVTFLKTDGTTQVATVVSNTPRTITFAAASIPSGQVEFYIRGADAFHRLYIRAVNETLQVSTAKPVPPDVIDCFPFARDGTRDIAPPEMFVNPNAILTDAWFTIGQGSNPTAVNLGARRGSILCFPAAWSLEEAEDDFELAKRQSIAGIDMWEVEITHEDVGGGNETTSVYQFQASNARERYTWRDDPAIIFGSGRWVLQNGPFFVDLPNRQIAGSTGIRFRAHNSLGWGPWSLGHGMLMSPGDPQYTGGASLEPPQTAALSSGTYYPNVSPGRRHLLALTGNITVGKAERRGGSTTPGLGHDPLVGEIFTLTVEQDATGGRLPSWDSRYKGLDGKDADTLPNRYSTWTFQVESANYYRCIGFLSGDK